MQIILKIIKNNNINAYSNFILVLLLLKFLIVYYEKKIININKNI